MKEHALTVNQVGQNDALGKRASYGGTCPCGWLSLAVWDSTTLLQRAYEAHLCSCHDRCEVAGSDAHFALHHAGACPVHEGRQS